MPATTKSLSLLFALLLVVALGGCPQAGSGGGASAGKGSGSTGGTTDEPTDPDQAKVLARVGDETITVGDLSEAINNQDPFIRRRYTSLEQRKKLLQQMVQFKVLAQEAKRRKIDEDPEVLRRVQRLMINRMMQKLQSELVSLEQISDADVKAYYDKHRALYQQPEKVRVSQIVTKTKEEAERVRALLDKKPGDTRYFAELVSLYSEDPASRAQQGDIDFFARDDDSVPEAVRKAAFGLEKLWQVAGPLALSDGRYVVLMKTGHREPVNRSLEDEKAQIKNRLFNERRQQAVEKYVEELKQKAKVEIVEENLSKVKLKRGPSAPPPAPHVHP